MKRIFLALILLVLGASYVRAEEITLLYTGESHAMIYPCSCPVEPDGGIARRAALIKTIRQAEPNVLLIDNGGFIAGGVMDQYSQGLDLDMKRSIVNLKGMEFMKYDAVGIGENEFNFGRKFLEENILNSGLKLVSCNLNLKGVAPFIIKEIAGVKIGIVGITRFSVAEKAEGVKFNDPLESVRSTVSNLKQQADIIIALSQMGENNDIELLKAVGGIDILMVGANRMHQEGVSKFGSTIILRPVFQARKLSKLKILLENKRIKDFVLEEARVSSQINDDKDILNIMPACFADHGCKKEGKVGVCQNPGTNKAYCAFQDAEKLSLILISVKKCRTCDDELGASFFKKRFPGVVINYLYYPSNEALKWIKDYNIKTLPAFILDKAASKQNGFLDLRDKFEDKGNFYLAKAELSGISYFIGRKKEPYKLDVFMSLYDPNADLLLNNLLEFNPKLHFLASWQNNKLAALKGTAEVEEYLRCVCVKKYHPGYFWNYMSCRAKNIESSWWQDCLPDFDLEEIKTCAQGQEGIDLLRENIALNEELEITSGPTYVLDNQEIFGSSKVPSKEEFRKLIKNN